MRCYLTNLLLLVALASLTSADEPSKTVINVGVYFETLCGDSMRFISYQLRPRYEELKEFLNVTFVPYGKAYQMRDGDKWLFDCQHGPAECKGNKDIACVIHGVKNGEVLEKQQDQTVGIVSCAMSNRNPPNAIEQCVRDAGLKTETQDRIVSCMNENPSKLGNDLLAGYGDKTKALEPNLTFVPTITINGVNDIMEQSNIIGNFYSYICNKLTNEEKTRAKC